MNCPHCHCLQPPSLLGLEKGKRAVFFIFIGDLRQAAKTGCSECALLLNALKLFKSDWVDDHDRYSVEVRAGVGVALEVFYRREPLYLEVFLEKFTSPSASLPQTIGSIALVSDRSDSSECTKLLTKWMKECSSEHEFCIGLDDDKPLPTRVLHISPDGKRVTLEEAAGRAGRYVALSYCWGHPATHGVLKTTTSTFEAHKAGIPVGSLPRTIIDAVSITRDQGFSYIWVDALCIIQDDKADWAREAASMCDVYSNAALTVVASRASGSSDGIFGPQSYHQSMRVAYKDTFVNVRKALKREHTDLTVLDREPFSDEPINKRAWTLQENLLSPRTIVYTSDELRWRCNTWRKCECDMLSSPIQSDEYFDFRVFRLPHLFKAQTIEEAYNKWDDIVMVYSSRSLTHESDRLPALAGLAKQFASMMKVCFNIESQYLAGMWEQNPLSLLWNVTSRDENTLTLRRERPGLWTAPSWSWASLVAPITIAPRIKLRSRISSFLATTELHAWSDEFGPVSSGSLRIKAPLLEDVSIRPLDRKKLSTRLWSLTQNGVVFGDFAPDFEDLDGEEGDESFTCAALLLGYFQVLRTYAAVILRRMDGEPAMYVRIGIANLGIVHRLSETDVPVPPGDFRGLVESDSHELWRVRRDIGVDEMLRNAPVKEVTII